MGSFLALLFGATVVGEIVPGLEAVGGLSAAGAVLALARSYWTSSSSRARERLSRVMDSVSGFLTQSGNAASVEAAAPRPESTGTEGGPAQDTS
jgi:hypothetical protein